MCGLNDPYDNNKILNRNLLIFLIAYEIFMYETKKKSRAIFTSFYIRDDPCYLCLGSSSIF